MIASENQRLEFREPVATYPHWQHYRLNVRMPYTQLCRPYVSPVLRLVKPRCRVEARAEIGPRGACLGVDVMGAAGDHNAVRVVRMERLVGAPVVQHHVVIRPGQAVSPENRGTP